MGSEVLIALAFIVVLCMGFALGWAFCTWNYLPVKNESGRYDVYDYSYPVDKRKIATAVNHKKASKLYWRNPQSRAIYHVI